MKSDVMQEWLDSSLFSGSNAGYVEELYEAYLQDPQSVDAQWRATFDNLPKLANSASEQAHGPIRATFAALAKQPRAFAMQSASAPASGDAKQVKVLQLINAFRFRGHQQARLDPLGLWERPVVPDLSLEFHELGAQDLQTPFHVGSYASGEAQMTLEALYQSLKDTYCGSVGAEYMHITSTEEKRWLQNRLESASRNSGLDGELKTRILDNLVAAEGLEKYLGAKFPGAKRFSLEGGDSLIPMIKELVRCAGIAGSQEVVIGMAHRGRLNVLINVLGKRPIDLFDEFAGKKAGERTGDVKYHMGFSSDLTTPGENIHLVLAFNPSHLEIVNPVVIGSVRARQDLRSDTDNIKVLPITIHGDSAIAGQGVVAETFNMSKTRAYGVGGTVRIVVNNQVGFTTSNPEDVRSTEYCTDIAKMVQAPIFHVNGDDPEAVIFVTQLALDYRNQFKRDVVIDLVCYRRHGHNEADEPSATQPQMYKIIKKHPTTRKLYADKLIADGFITEAEVKKHSDDYRDALDHGECVVKEWCKMDLHMVDWTPYLGHDWDTPYDSRASMDKLVQLGHQACQYPEHLKPQRQVGKIYEDRRMMLRGEKLLDWGCAETLAYASLLGSDFNIRITGQDAGRGTFFHRHAVLHNQEQHEQYIPLQNLADSQGRFEVYDSVLSEEAVLAFEYGYATTEPTGLVIWEAQFGDFANGAQVVIDQFLSSGEQKWGRQCGLVMLLPHGYEGQGPEHSSARLERYMQLCAQHNMQVCAPTTPAQIFHLLRRQVLRPMRRPLVVMSPKSLLRHPQAISSLEQLSNGSFLNALDDPDALPAQSVSRVVLCSGKVFYDLLEARRKHNKNDTALVRVEQLYPFPEAEVQAIMNRYSNATQFVWCQEEPKNQGCWYCSLHHFKDVIPHGASIEYAGREASASPAVGYASLHAQQQQELVAQALGLASST